MGKAKKTPANSIEYFFLKKHSQMTLEMFRALTKALPMQKAFIEGKAFVEKGADRELCLLIQEFKTSPSSPATRKMHIAIALTLEARWKSFANKNDQPLDVISFDIKQKSAYIEVTVKPVKQEVLKQLHSRSSNYKKRK